MTMKFIPFIIFIIVVINVLRRIAEFQRNRPGSDEGWDEGASPDGSPPPVARPGPGPGPRPPPTPSDRVREILEQLAQADRSAAEPAAPPVFRPPPAPVAPVPVPMAPVPMAPISRRYLSDAEQEGAVETSPPREAVATAPIRAGAFDGSHVYRESLAKAFPASPAVRARDLLSRQRAPYVVGVKGRRTLRRAIVLSEVLGPPRAFDV